MSIVNKERNVEEVTQKGKAHPLLCYLGSLNSELKMSKSRENLEVAEKCKTFSFSPESEGPESCLHGL